MLATSTTCSGTSRGEGQAHRPLHETYLKLLLWGNFIEIPTPLILLANRLQTPRAARFDFEFFDKQKRGLHTGHAKLGFILEHFGSKVVPKHGCKCEFETSGFRR